VTTSFPVGDDGCESVVEATLEVDPVEPEKVSIKAAKLAWLDSLAGGAARRLSSENPALIVPIVVWKLATPTGKDVSEPTDDGVVTTLITLLIERLRWRAGMKLRISFASEC
jgi:hypothetical protein